VIGEGTIFFKGCNVHIGTYTLDGNNVVFGEGWASNAAICDEDHDQDLSDLIQTTTSFKFNENTGRLIFSDVGGTLLTMKAIA
jgi:heat shock protein HslJ